MKTAQRGSDGGDRPTPGPRAARFLPAKGKGRQRSDPAGVRAQGTAHWKEGKCAWHSNLCIHLTWGWPGSPGSWA